MLTELGSERESRLECQQSPARFKIRRKRCRPAGPFRPRAREAHVGFGLGWTAPRSAVPPAGASGVARKSRALRGFLFRSVPRKEWQCQSCLVASRIRIRPSVIPSCASDTKPTARALRLRRSVSRLRPSDSPAHVPGKPDRAASPQARKKSCLTRRTSFAPCSRRQLPCIRQAPKRTL